MNKKIMSLSFMLSFLFGTCASQSYALPESGTKGQAMTDYVQISRQDFNQLQSQIAQLQNALNDLAKGRGRSNQKRGFLVSAVYFSALIILLTLLGSMAYVFYDYNCNFKGIKENEELGLMNYLLSKFKFKQEVTGENGEKAQKITDMDEWLRDLNSWTQEMQIWLKDVEGMYKDLAPLLTALKEGKILDYMLDNFTFSYEGEVEEKNENIKDNNSTDEENERENNKSKNVKTITLRKLLKKPQLLFRGELKEFAEAFNKGNLLNHLLDNLRIGEKTLREMLDPILKLLGENSLEQILNLKIKIKNKEEKEEEKTIKEIFVEPILVCMTAYLGKDEKGERLKSLENWKGKSDEFNDKVIGYSKIFQNLDDKYIKEKKSVLMEELLKDLEQLEKIKESYERLIGKSEEEIFKESENLLFDCSEVIQTILGDKNLARKFGNANGLFSAGNVVDALKNLGGFETKAQLRPQNQFSLYRMVVKLYKKLQHFHDRAIEKDKENNIQEEDSSNTMKMNKIFDNFLTSL